MTLPMAAITVALLACDSCKLGLSDTEAQAMRYTIYMLLGCIYTLMGAITFYVVRMMRREAREEAERRLAVAAATVAPATPVGSAR